MNQPDRVAAWLVDTENGEQPMEVTDDAKLPGSIKVMLNAQDHTIGNMIRAQLLLDPNVVFAGYRIPHPLANRVEIRIQTDPAMTPYISPRKALLNACAALVNQGRDLKSQFLDQAKALELTGRATGGIGGGLGGGPQGRLGPLDGAAGDAYGSLGGAYDGYGQSQSQAVDDPYGY